MNLLLATHVVLWWQGNDPRLVPPVRRAIAQANNIFVSAASAWEVAIKLSLRKLRLPEPFLAGVRRAGFEPLPITFEHAQRVQLLAWHHRDPFDRMLIAQALEETTTLVSADAALRAYDVDLLWS